MIRYYIGIHTKIKRGKLMAKKEGALDKIVEETFLETVKSTFEDNLISVAIYGSYVSGNFAPGVSDINILILLEKPMAEQIEKLGKATLRIIRKYKITPLILTKKEFISSADVFPMEYYDIKDRHKILYGEDETKDLSLTRKNLRHQLEDRLRGNVASLRQLIIASRGKSRVLKVYLKNWYGSLGALFRGLLRLKEISPVPSESKDVIKKINEVFKLDNEPFLNLLALRKGEKIDPRQLVVGLVASLENLITIVDKMDLKA
jgi:predicted nucleotidyltransferase